MQDYSSKKSINNRLFVAMFVMTKNKTYATFNHSLLLGGRHSAGLVSCFS